MRFVSLFAGIGGFDLGLERAGFTCAGQVEIDDYATRVLERHWPDVPRWRDVRTFTGTEFGPFDMLVGGYPCQPFSVAGSRKGEHDERHLWPEVHRIIRNVRPRVVLLENVPGHLTLGFDRVLGDLAACGYDAEWDCIPAAAVGAPHRRDRLFIVAYPQGEPSNGGTDHARKRVASGQEPEPRDGRGTSNVANANSSRSNPRKKNANARNVRDRNWNDTQTQSQWNQQQPGIASNRRWDPEPNVGRVADGIPHRVDRLRTLGNAVVPQVAEFIGHRIKEVWNAVQD